MPKRERQEVRTKLDGSRHLKILKIGLSLTFGWQNNDYALHLFGRFLSLGGFIDRLDRKRVRKTERGRSDRVAERATRSAAFYQTA